MDEDETSENERELNQESRSNLIINGGGAA